ncbi:MAG: hypothetical protein JWN04_4479 [Myxococcaceae bacterium]|nr:hypothetical protein [Myxococcaceae bacterium]
MSERPVSGPSLRELQEDFWALVRAPTGVGRGMSELPQHAKVLASVVSDERATALARLELYANMYFYRLRDNLALDFPRLAAALGDDGFHNLATDYLLACPSQDPSVRQLGQRLSGFWRQHGMTPERPWLSDLAALEWARLSVADRADDEVLTLEALQASAEGGFCELSLQLIEAHTTVSVHCEVEVAWRTLLRGELLEPVADTMEQTLLVWRQPDLHVHHRKLSADEVRFLPQLRQGLRFVELCEQLLSDGTPEQAARRAITAVASWTREGLLRAR